MQRHHVTRNMKQNHAESHKLNKHKVADEGQRLSHGEFTRHANIPEDKMDKKGWNSMWVIVTKRSPSRSQRTASKASEFETTSAQETVTRMKAKITENGFASIRKVHSRSRQTNGLSSQYAKHKGATAMLEWPTVSRRVNT